jgi:Kef-type K+ transport system membrane component KefB
MHPLPPIFLTLGALFLVGLATDALGARTRLPRVTLLLAFGFAVGSSGLGLLGGLDRLWFPVVSHIALAMVGFLLGESLGETRSRDSARSVMTISIAVVLVTIVVLMVGLLALGVALPVALALAGIATATDPAATTDVVHETRAEGPFTHTLLGIVAIDDAWGLIVFSVLLGIAQSLSADGTILVALQHGIFEVGGGVLVGIGLGVPTAFLTGRVRPGEPTLAEALGAVFLCAGIALWLEVSFLLATMVLGTVVAARARHHKHPFRAIRGIEWPFLILFFVFAGASLQISALLAIGVAGGGYIVLRAVARIAGGWIGARIAHAPDATGRWIGFALMPQAGVALGMALVAVQHLPELRDVVLPIAIASTVFFELVGPLLTQLALRRIGESHPRI